ncbi:hypothetical protein CYY_008493 [Polysphondylium violaceum]|uniref:Cullin-4 n=1 Tax=Polysphondylium violaceum TaxID=133409 RepID=A0A8J4PMX4_9MYCE|nr:hypothetical protein CYY_008493 [Polysphondylium violaceum]
MSSGINPPPAKKILVIKNLKQAPTKSLAESYEVSGWNMLSDAIDCINSQKPTNHTLEQLYKTVENLCSDKNSSANLYKKMSFQLQLYINETIQPLVNFTDATTFLREMYIYWDNVTKQLIVIRSIFLYLDRTYAIQQQHQQQLQQQQQQQQQQLQNDTSLAIKPIWDLGLMIFRENLAKIPELKRKLYTGLLISIERERKGDTLDRDLMHSLFKMLVSLQIYQPFEKDFLQETTFFYGAEGNILVNEYEIGEYLRHVQNRIQEENDRSLRYLDISTKKPLLNIVEKQLVEKHIATILSKGFSQLMQEKRIDDLARLYSLFQRVNAIQPLKQSWATYIKTTGQSMVLDLEKDATLIQDLLDFKDGLDSILEKSFQRNETLTYSLKESFEYFINTRPNKPAELIAKFIDSKLKSGGANKRMTEDELESVLGKSLILFRYIQGKDVFEAFYKQDLGRRLLLDKSASIDAEKSMILKLKTECGTNFTAHFEEMFKDIELSNEMMDPFRHSLADKGYTSIEMNVYVLTGVYWNLSAPIQANLPNEFTQYQELFKQFYLQKHHQRVLKWQNAMGYCVVKAHYPLGTKELIVSLFQTLVLYLFNDRADSDGGSITFKQIQEETQIPEGELKRNLQYLCHSKSELLVKSPRSKVIANTDSFTFNKKFTAKLVRIKVNALQSQETVEETKKTNENVIHDRQYQIDATIVRIMKSRKTLAHNLLMSELISQLKFSPKPADLKKRIESLIDKEYLARDPENAMIYNYLA